MSDSREQLAEALAADLAALCAKHSLTAFVETTQSGGVAYHLLQRQAALTLILADWRPSPVMH
jgi:hypothetical protein